MFYVLAVYLPDQREQYKRLSGDEEQGELGSPPGGA